MDITYGHNHDKVRSGIRRLLNSLFFLTVIISANGQASIHPLQFFRSVSSVSKGTIMLLTGEEHTVDNRKNEAGEMTRFLNTRGFDVVIPNKLTLAAGLKAFRQLKAGETVSRVRGDRLVIMGLGSGGYTAAAIVQRLEEKEQPDDLMLISPAGLDETISGTVIPAIMPPPTPAARLWVVMPAAAPPSSMASCREYVKTWKGYDGIASIRMVSDTADTGKIAACFPADFFSPAAPTADTAANPAAIPVPGYAAKRHEEKVQLIAREKFNLILIGNSITNNFEKPAYQPVWDQFFAPRKALNLGYSGYRTENILWNISHGELDGQSPKVVILEIGTNNIDEKNYPTRHTAGQLAGGIRAIVTLLRQKVPAARIILLRCFPGSYDGPCPTSHRAILERASDLVSKIADGKHVFYCDVNHVFLRLDGSVDHTLMPDWLHPSPAGAKAWAQAMEPLLSRLMGDSSRDTEIQVNTAIVPVPKLEEDSYDWWQRHADVLRMKDSLDPEIVLIGNSITHFWGGEFPPLKYANGQPRIPNGPRSWNSLFGPYRVLNLGFGWDRTQNALWRLDNGELDGLHPRVVVIDIGTNNTSQTAHARMNTASEIVEGIRAVCGRVRSKVPGAKIILMAIFPREQRPDHPRRILIDETNRLLEAFAKEQRVTFVDIGPSFLAPDGSMLPGMTLDGTHPTDRGYQRWADAIRPYITAP